VKRNGNNEDLVYETNGPYQFTYHTTHSHLQNVNNRFREICFAAVYAQWINKMYDSPILLTLWRSLLPYGYSCKASGARPG